MRPLNEIPSRGRMRKTIFCVGLSIAGLFVPAVNAQTSRGVDENAPETAGADRPRIGLALEGGGALGIAHIGVLMWLHEHRIPVDEITGTSMGALIGSLAASGHSAEEMEHLTTDTSFQRPFYTETLHGHSQLQEANGSKRVASSYIDRLAPRNAVHRQCTDRGWRIERISCSAAKCLQQRESGLRRIAHSVSMRRDEPDDITARGVSLRVSSVCRTRFHLDPGSVPPGEKRAGSLG